MFDSLRLGDGAFSIRRFAAGAANLLFALILLRRKWAVKIIIRTKKTSICASTFSPHRGA
jgi:hypothetical protein